MAALMIRLSQSEKSSQKLPGLDYGWPVASPEIYQDPLPVIQVNKHNKKNVCDLFLKNLNHSSKGLKLIGIYLL